MITTTVQLPILFSDASELLARFLTCAPVKTLNAAILQRQFQPVYQPIFNSQTGEIAGIEVLAVDASPVWRYSPDIFIPLAEEHGLIASLTHQLIQQVIADLQSRLPLFPNGLYLNLNLSPENCLDPRFESDVVALMQKACPGSGSTGYRNYRKTPSALYPSAKRVVCRVEKIQYRRSVR